MALTGNLGQFQERISWIFKGISHFSDPDSLAKLVTSSADAGRYLCDFVYFKSLHSSKGRALFVHVPDLDRPYSKEQLASSLVTILKLLLKQI